MTSQRTRSHRAPSPQAGLKGVHTWVEFDDEGKRFCVAFDPNSPDLPIGVMYADLDASRLRTQREDFRVETYKVEVERCDNGDHQYGHLARCAMKVSMFGLSRGV